MSGDIKQLKRQPRFTGGQGQRRGSKRRILAARLLRRRPSEAMAMGPRR